MTERSAIEKLADEAAQQQGQCWNSIWARRLRAAIEADRAAGRFSQFPETGEVHDLEAEVERLQAERDHAAIRFEAQRHLTDLAEAERDRARAAGTQVVTEVERLRAERCTCPWVDPKYWTTYYGAIEPGSTREYDPTCPLHGPLRDRAERAETKLAEIRALADEWEWAEEAPLRPWRADELRAVLDRKDDQ